MRARGAAVQGTLAAIGLVAAYSTWQREPERAPGEVVVLDVNHNDLATIRYDDGTKWVQLEPGPAKDGIWLRMSPHADPKTPERFVRGNDAAEKLFDRFAPLRATRALGALGADKLKELGLDAPKKKIEVSARGSKTVYLVGTPPAGVYSPYVKDEHDGKVYVLVGGIVSDLESAPFRAMERALHGFQPADFDALTISAGGKKRELVQSGTDLARTVKLASKATPAKPDEMAKNWHDKLWRMAAGDVLGQAETPTGGEPAIALRIDYSASAKSKGWIEVGRVTVPPPAPPAGKSAPPAPATPTTEIYARTEHTAGWVKLPANAEEVLKEADKVAAAE